MEIVEQGGEPTINVFRYVVENEWLDTVVHHDDRPRPGEGTRASLSGNMGRPYPVIKDLEERYAQAAQAMAR